MNSEKLGSNPSALGFSPNESVNSVVIGSLYSTKFSTPNDQLPYCHIVLKNREPPTFADIAFPVLVLTTFDEHDLVLKCIQLGAKGYLQKDVSLESLISAIRCIINGELWIQPAITEQVQNHNLISGVNVVNHLFETLTSKETQVLRLIAAGYSNNEIAGALHNSDGTIRNTVSAILAKLNVRDRTRAVITAMEHGLI